MVLISPVPTEEGASQEGAWHWPYLSWSVANHLPQLPLLLYLCLTRYHDHLEFHRSFFCLPTNNLLDKRAPRSHGLSLEHLLPKGALASLRDHAAMV